MRAGFEASRELARRIRGHALNMVHAASASHIGSCLSMADLLAVLYGHFLRIDPVDPAHPDRDRFVLSKGHGVAILYAVLAERGFFPIEELRTYCAEGSKLLAHPSHEVPGIEVSTGSLGHGLPIGCGLALAAQRDRLAHRVVVLLSDGELDEGSNWEAILFAAHHGLERLIAIVDYNRIQSFGAVSEVLGLEPLAAKWQAFGWHVAEVDGHDHAAIAAALDAVPAQAGKPTVILAHTVKGKGVSFMEDQLAWHYRSPSDDQLAMAHRELGGAR